MEQTNELRMSGIGGSDAGVILGLSKYKTPYQLYLEKIGNATQFEGNEATHFGNVLEELVAEEFSTRTGKKVRKCNETIRHKENSFIMAHIDRKVVGEKSILECKTSLSKWWSDEDWGEEDTDNVPDVYYAQCQHYLYVLGYDKIYLAALLSGPTFRIYTIERNDEFIQIMIDRELTFQKCILERNPPKCANVNDVNKKYTESSESNKIADEYISEKLELLKSVQFDIKLNEEMEEQLKTEIMEYMGENKFLVDGNNKKLVTNTIIQRTNFNYKLFCEEHPEFDYDEYMNTSSYHKMTINKKKENK